MNARNRGLNFEGRWVGEVFAMKLKVNELLRNTSLMSERGLRFQCIWKIPVFWKVHTRWLIMAVGKYVGCRSICEPMAKSLIIIMIIFRKKM